MRLQALAAAGRARRGGLEARDLLAHPGRVGFAVAPVKVRNHALEGFLRLVGAHAVIIEELDFLIAGAVEDDVLDLLGQLVPGLRQVELVMRRERLQRLRLVGRGGFGPRRDGAVEQAKILVRNNHRRVDLQLLAETVARGARAEGIVEREQARLDFGNREAGDRAGKVGAEIDAFGFGLAGLDIGVLGDGDALR